MTITDINDLPPVIDQMSPIEVDVVEHVRNQSILAVITATDGDLGDNAHISYSITSGNINSKSNFVNTICTDRLQLFGSLFSPSRVLEGPVYRVRMKNPSAFYVYFTQHFTVAML